MDDKDEGSASVALLRLREVKLGKPAVQSALAQEREQKRED